MGLAMFSTLKSHLPLSGPMKSLGTGTALSLLLTGSPVSAAVNLIANPDFTATSGPSTRIQLNVSSGPTFSNGAVIGPWTASGLVFLFGPNSSSASGTNADLAPGAPNHFGATGGFCLWGPSSAGCPSGAGVGNVPNGLTIGPSGGNFLAMDGALQSSNTPPVSLRGDISQTLMGLEVGVPVMIEFNWAAAQQTTFFGPNTEQLQVSLGSETQSTAVVDNASQGFIPWMHEEFTFTPTMSSEVLSFLAIGTPAIGTGSAGPPFVLLDGGVSAREVPELSTWAMIALGFAGLGYAGFRSNRRKPVMID